MAPGEALITVEVAWALPGLPARCLRMELPSGSLVGQAVIGCGAFAQAPRLLRLDHPPLGDLSPLQLDAQLAEGHVLAVWGRVVSAATPLRDRDRIEILGPLRVDPKEARRQRYAQHLQMLKTRPRAGQKRGRKEAAAQGLGQG